LSYAKELRSMTILIVALKILFAIAVTLAFILILLKAENLNR